MRVMRMMRAVGARVHAGVHVVELGLALLVAIVVLAFMATSSADTVGMLSCAAVAAWLVARGKRALALVPLALGAIAVGVALGPSRAAATLCGASFPLGYWAWIRKRRAELGLAPRPSAAGLMAWLVGLRLATWIVPFDPVVAPFLIAAALAANADAYAPLVARPETRRPRLALAVVLVALASLAVDQGLRHLRPGLVDGREWCEGRPPSRDADVLRVAALGDSTTFGVIVPRALSYPRRLESLLEERLGRDVAVVSCGVPGAASEDLVEQVAEARAWAPDLVTVMIGVNDLREAGWRERLPAHLGAAVDPAWDTVILSYPFGALRGSDSLARLETELAAYAERRGLAFVDVAAALPPRPWSFLFETVHPNQIGHRRIAEALVGPLAARLSEERGSRRPSGHGLPRDG